jgi:hypothetical protein
VNSEELKLNLTQRLMKIDDTSTLERMEDLIIQEEMENRVNGSMEAITKGEVFTIDGFARSNQEWLRKKSM